MPRQPGEVEVTCTLRRWPVPAERVERLVRFVAGREGAELAYVEVAIVGRRRMATLNAELLGHAGPTDQISLDLGAAPGGGLVAQLIVCADVAAIEARRRGHSPAAELLLYVTHGLLHLLDYDDHTAADSTRMHAREDELLAEFGVGRVFGR